MAGSEVIPKFHDLTRPPIGSWHYYYDINDRNTLFRRATAVAVFDELEKHRRNNGKFTSREDIEREVWALWCSYQPQRCGLTEDGSAQNVVLPKEIDKAHFGPIIWRALNHIAVMFDYVGREFFLQFVTQIPNLMTCPMCRSHWEILIQKYPPAAIRTKKEACVWAHAVHEAVNESAGKPSYSYAQAVKEYGFPL